MTLLDDAIRTVASGAASALVIGGIYCSALEACDETMDIARADAWSVAFAKWRDAQPSMIAFRAESLAHRAPLMQLRGTWRDALDELEPVIEWLDQRPERAAAGLAYYQRGELHRLRGEHDEAHAAYQEAATRGHEPQPGLALLWLAEGRIDTAADETRRLLGQVAPRTHRSRMLLASTEVLLAGGHVAEARACAEELSRIDSELCTSLSYAASTNAIGAVLLGEDRPVQALVALRDAMTTWEELGARYHAARARVLIAGAHRELGDEAAVKSDLLAAAHAFDVLGARADRVHAEEFFRRKADAAEPFLTAPQLDVLRLLAAGMSNAAIAESLDRSEAVIAKVVVAILYQLRALSREHVADRARLLGLV